jgi:serine/threonine-protein kinase RsbW
VSDPQNNPLVDPSVCPAAVNLEIPSRPEFVGVARLAILGVASRMRFTYDEVEDIRLAVGEACTRAIDRADSWRRTGAHIRLHCLIDVDRLTIEVKEYGAPQADGRTGGEQPASDGGDLSGVLIRILMDEVETSPLPDSDGQVLRMVKYTAR